MAKIKKKISYFDRVTELRKELLGCMENDINFLLTLSEGIDVGMAAIFSLIHKERPPREKTLTKIESFIKSYKRNHDVSIAESIK